MQSSSLKIHCSFDDGVACENGIYRGASEDGIHKLDERKCVQPLRQYPEEIDQ